MNKYRLAIVSDEPYFDGFKEGCASNLSRHGFSIGVLDKLPEDGKWDSLLVIGIHKFPDMPFYRNTTLLGVQTEQLPLAKTANRRLRRNLNRFHAVRGYYKKLFEWNPSLYDAGVGGDVFVPYGCTLQSAHEGEKRYDVLFVGNVGGSPRRNGLLTYLAGQFNFYPDFSPGFGMRKAEAIRSSKICLNIHYYEDCGFESPRIFDYLSHGAFVLSERSSSTHPFTVGRDLEDYSDRKELTDKIAYYLGHDAKRREIAGRGFQTAGKYGYDLISSIIALEIRKILEIDRNNVHEFVSWSLARARCDYFRLRDYISIKRRLSKAV
jgi:hypothetical protein